MTKPVCPECLHAAKDKEEHCEHCGFFLGIDSKEKQQERYLRGPAIGALLWTQGWAFGARLYFWFILSLIPVVNFFVLVVLVFRGRRLSWQKGQWISWETFEKRMRFLTILSFIWIYLLIILFSIIFI